MQYEYEQFNEIWSLKQVSRAHRSLAYKSQVFINKETEAAAEPQRIGKGRREIWKWNFEFIQIERKAYKDFFPMQSFSL